MNITEYLYNKYGDYTQTSTEVYDMVRTLYDPAIEMKGKIEGKIEGKVEDILELLEDLGSVPESLAAKIKDQKDLATLSKWHKLASKSDSLNDFEEKMNKTIFIKLQVE
ncbi:hypothetical protein RBH29_02725 [Herbivorax sp. ANBcel31]|uniref:hypothetical protein n=1 Tax=Herbivorax sp. ANBcel31 TaxID=3069754 RepID=UPI0027B0299F|nr:hypothetical protein [Herbivorax sp. ANBcel31]MDQ2085352.1 hypothetical protein [Herbivorax sp. ANBcel31]